ncbi:carboxymuconolactone decarboxylase family protein [Actinomadura kijaniata]|uniref:carboxymuconolactone decarboxylase family protein n=1 Tax=Actinomadura kijaniata TaxID=46161 RepID=UPI000B0B00EA|nr:carboxymuconolactone decarboxylase family protein [Actinomadura kijaniata]
MSIRMANIPELIGEGYQGFASVDRFLHRSELPNTIVHLVKLRVSQINGCALCVDMHSHDARKEGETDERLWSVAAWREAPFYTDQERAALALAEAATRIADNPDGVPDDVWNEAAEHFDEKQLAALVAAIALINAWNRIGVTAHIPAGFYRL